MDESEVHSASFLQYVTLAGLIQSSVVFQQLILPMFPTQLIELLLTTAYRFGHLTFVLSSDCQIDGKSGVFMHCIDLDI